MINKLTNLALKLRQNTFRAFVKKGEAHLGGSFSIIETLIFLFEKLLKKQDKFILSKAHASYPLCIILGNMGFKIKLKTHLEIDKKNKIFCTTGSLGHGLPISTGIAFARKFQKKRGKVYVMISDGECQEGTTWESLLISSKHKLDNLVIIIDYNKIQALSKLNDALPLESLSKKIKSFNCHCINIKNGHSFNSLLKGFGKIYKLKNKPIVVIINTIKGKGLRKFENDPIWHARKIEGKDIKYGEKILGFKI